MILSMKRSCTREFTYTCNEILCVVSEVSDVSYCKTSHTFICAFGSINENVLTFVEDINVFRKVLYFILTFEEVSPVFLFIVPFYLNLMSKCISL